MPPATNAMIFCFLLVCVYYIIERARLNGERERERERRREREKTLIAGAREVSSGRGGFPCFFNLRFLLVSKKQKGRKMIKKERFSSSKR